MEIGSQEATLTKVVDSFLGADDNDPDWHKSQKAPELSWFRYQPVTVKDEFELEVEEIEELEELEEAEDIIMPKVAIIEGIRDNIILRQHLSSQIDYSCYSSQGTKEHSSSYQVLIPPASPASVMNTNSVREANVVLRRHVIPQVYQGRSVAVLLSMQTSEGFWPWRDELLSCMGLIPTIVAATMEIQDIKSHSATIAATAVAIRYFKSITREGDNPWDIHTSQASCWLAGQIEPSQLASLLDQADDLF